MAHFALTAIIFAIIYMGWSLTHAEEVGSGGDVTREARHLKKRLCIKLGICGGGNGGYQGYQQGYQGYQQGYQGHPTSQYPPINIAISQSQSSASQGGGGYSNGYYPNNYQTNYGYGGYGGYSGYGGYGGYQGGYRPGPGYYNNGQGSNNNQFNGNFYGPQGGGYGFQGQGPFFDESSDNVSKPVHEDQEGPYDGSSSFDYEQGNGPDGRSQGFAVAGSFAVASRQKE